ncbi:MAG: hypothetical protein R3F65_03865 [bacterium]
MRHPLRALLALALTAPLLACGGAPRPSTDGGARPVDPTAPPLPAPDAFYTPGLPAYAAAAALPPEPVEQQLALDLARTIVPPPPLDCLAREYAARFAADGRDPGPGTVQALAHHCGYWTRPASSYSVTAPDGVALAAHFRKLPPAALEGLVGLGVVRHPDGRVTATLLHDPGEVRLDAPVARIAATQTLTGRVLRGEGELELWVDDAEGPQRIEIALDERGRFEAPLPAGDGPVELARKQGRFRRTVALLRRSPAAPDYPTPPPPLAEPLDRRAVADALTAAINTRRAAAGLPPLTHERRLDPPLDDWLSRVAGGTADDTPPGMLDDRGWPYTRLRYAISGGRTAEQAIELLVEAPTGRRAVLTDEVDRVAVGLHPFADGSGFDVVFAAVQTFAPAPPEQARATLLDALNQSRRRDGSRALAADPALTALAQRLAEDALAGRRPWAETVPAAMAAVRDERLARGAFAAGAFTAATITEAPFDQEPGAMSPEVAHVGIGVAGGPLPGGGAPRHVIVYVVAAELPKSDI